MKIIKLKLFLFLIAAPVAAFAAGEQATAAGSDVATPYSPYADVDYPTDVYFGDTHVHTALSGAPVAPVPP